MTFVADTTQQSSPAAKAVHIESRLADVLKDKAKELGITRRDLIEQMLKHCLQG